MTEETKQEEKETPKSESSDDKSVVVPEGGITAQIDAYKKENDRREAILKREEDLAARKLLGGNTPYMEPEQKKEETPREYAERVMRGDLTHGK